MKLLSFSEKKFRGLVKSITGIRPVNITYYQLAFQHKSVMQKDAQGNPLNNERLEFLGDAVLGATIAHDLFVRFPHTSEGELTKIRSRIVNRSNLNSIALKMGFEKLIKTHQISDMSCTHIPGDALEALIGAIYIDRGEKKARKFIRRKIIFKQIDLPELIHTDTNYKSMLIEWGQKYKYPIQFITEEYPISKYRHQSFIAKAYVNDVVMGEGAGGSKKEAQQKAACKVLEMVANRERFKVLLKNDSEAQKHVAGILEC
ncbi:MAG: ribonuclease III [Cytophagaceae bacterium]|jgi:ribonuclease-3|nr:ribonuclease III [Cytophagaceae bacterium]